MLAKVTCKECDLVIDSDSFRIDSNKDYQVMKYSMWAHYQNTGHTLVKLELTLEEQDMKGDFYHG